MANYPVRLDSNNERAFVELNPPVADEIVLRPNGHTHYAAASGIARRLNDHIGDFVTIAGHA
jgi:hypothetical protein